MHCYLFFTLIPRAAAGGIIIRKLLKKFSDTFQNFSYNISKAASILHFELQKHIF